MPERAGARVRDLLVVVPSRGRPASIERLCKAMDETCRGDTTLLLGLDDDDPELDEYLNFAANLPVVPMVEMRPALRQVVAWINELAAPRTGEYRFIGHIGDDNIPRTDGWDVAIMEALESAPFAFGNDLNPHRPPGSLCCHVFTRSEVVAALGYLGPPSLQHSFVDDAWMAWGRAAGITFLPDVILEHLHFTTGGSDFDETYAGSAALIAADQAAFAAYCAGGLDADIARIRAAVSRRAVPG